MNAPRIHLQIDRLVLRGVPHEQRDALVASLQRELARQLAQAGAHEGFRSRHAASMRAALPALRPGATPVQLGAEAARAIVKAVGS